MRSHLPWRLRRVRRQSKTTKPWGLVHAATRYGLVVCGDNARVRGKVKVERVIIDREMPGSLRCDDLPRLQPQTRSVDPVRHGPLEMHDAVPALQRCCTR